MILKQRLTQFYEIRKFCQNRIFEIIENSGSINVLMNAHIPNQEETFMYSIESSWERLYKAMD